MGYHHQGICRENFTAYCADSFSKNNPGFEGVLSFAMECLIKCCYMMTYLTLGNQYQVMHSTALSFSSQPLCITFIHEQNLSWTKIQIRWTMSNVKSHHQVLFPFANIDFELWGAICLKTKKTLWSCFDICAIVCFYSNAVKTMLLDKKGSFAFVCANIKTMLYLSPTSPSVLTFK